MSKKISHIYLVDDEETFNFLNKTVIQMVMPEIQLSIFSDGQAAIDALHDEAIPNPDLIFLDMYMPLMDGWGFLKEISGKETDHVSVIMLTASIDATEKEKALTYPFVKNVYSKPLTVEVIQEIIGN